MSARTLARLIAVYLVALVVGCVGVREHVSLSEVDGPVVESQWKDGALIARRVRASGEPASEPRGGATLVEEKVVGTAPLSKASWAFELGLVAGRDGVLARLDGREAYVTVDDLLAAQAYDHGATFLDASLGFGVERAVVFHLLGERLGVPPREVEARAALRRVRFTRTVAGAREAERVTGPTLDREAVLAGVRAAALHLARNIDDEGRFRYLVLATTNTPLAGYNWPRHAGTTYFLAQAAHALDDPQVRYAALLAASLLRESLMKDCGELACIAEDDLADVGSSALALIAFTEIVRTGADGAYRPAVVELSLFLRSMQREDGELMHLYDRTARAPQDVQFLYSTGEAALALARAHTITGDPRDLAAASKALSYLAASSWSFFGSRYYWSEEHWTCQAMSELWERAPDQDALRFCLQWHEYQRALQYEAGVSPFDADGAFGFGPVVTPRVTPASSRGEAAAATLDVLSREHRAGRPVHGEHLARLDDELRRALAFVLRHQLTDDSGVMHLFAAPDDVRGAVPGSPVDLYLRIDYAQHAGSAMIRWLELPDLR
jgi:hypothetical protein